MVGVRGCEFGLVDHSGMGGGGCGKEIREKNRIVDKVVRQHDI
jgi:hypothetical protein